MQTITVEDVTIPAADGLPLAATVFHADAPTAWCSIASAVGVRRRYYRRFATFLAEHGITTVTFDYRGIGDSPARHGTPTPTMSTWAEQDLEGILAWIHARDPARQFHVGHSGGGQFLGLCPSNVHVDAAVAVASQWGDWRLWPKHLRRRMWTLWHLFLPISTRLRGHFPARFFNMGEPLPRGVALEWARWCRRRDFLLDGEPGRQERFDAFTGRMLLVSLSDDEDFAPHAAGAALLAHYRNAQAEHIDLDPASLEQEQIGHFGYFTKRGADHWPELASWLLQDAA